MMSRRHIHCFFIYEKEIHCFLQQQRAALPLLHTSAQQRYIASPMPLRSPVDQVTNRLRVEATTSAPLFLPLFSPSPPATAPRESFFPLGRAPKSAPNRQTKTRPLPPRQSSLADRAPDPSRGGNDSRRLRRRRRRAARWPPGPR